MRRNVMKRETQKDELASLNENKVVSLVEPDCIGLLVEVLSALNDIKSLLGSGSKQVSELHNLIIPKPKEKVIPKTLEELRDRMIQRDILDKKKKKEA